MATVGLDRLVESVVQRAAQDLDSFIDTLGNTIGLTCLIVFIHNNSQQQCGSTKRRPA